jgi:hypothetical protein
MRILLPLLLAALLPACATVTSGTSQNVSVITEPPGASCQLQRDGAVVGVVNPTPGTVNVSKSTRDLAVNCSRAGSVATVQTVRSEFQAATAGNILLGGLIGVAVDAASGAMSKYPETVRLILPPETFTSDTERDAFFASRAAEARQRYAEQIQTANGTCGTAGRDVCTSRISTLEAERDAELARLEAQRLAAARRT